MNAPKVTPITKNTVVTDLMTLVEHRITKNIPFMNAKIEIIKLTLAETMEIQKMAQDAAGEDPDMAFKMIRDIIRMGAPAAKDFEDEQFNNFPMEDLNKLADEILKYGGMDPNKK